jgi:hypothetical protein
MITRKRCKVCQHDDREILEARVKGMQTTADELDREMGWASDVTARHMRNHAGDYDNNSNPQCKLCTDPSRIEWELALREGEISPTKVAEAIDCSASQIRTHLKTHLKPLVQKSAAQLIAAKDINEIEMLSVNVQRLDVMVDEWMQREDLTPKEMDTLVKLAKEVRESLKYLLEFKGKLIHKRQDTIVIAQMQIVQEVLSQQHPSVWLDIKSKMQEKLV